MGSNSSQASGLWDNGEHCSLNPVWDALSGRQSTRAPRGEVKAWGSRYGALLGKQRKSMASRTWQKSVVGTLWSVLHEAWPCVTKRCVDADRDVCDAGVHGEGTGRSTGVDMCECRHSCR